MVRSERMELRCTLEEKERWVRAAGGSRLVSDWLRSLANAAVENSKLDGTALVGNAIALLRDEPELPMSPRKGWEAVAPAEEVVALPSMTKANAKPVFASERPRAGRRTMMCAHRVPVTAFCARCD